MIGNPWTFETMKNSLRPVLLLICAVAGIAGAKPARAEISGPTLQLVSAIGSDDIAQAQAAIAAGADVNANAGEGRTPLIQAVMFIRPQLVKLLVERGADPRREADDAIVGNAVTAAFFAMNGLISVGFFAFVLADVLVS